MNKPNWRFAPKTATTAAALALAATAAIPAIADTWYWVAQNATPAYSSGTLEDWGCDASLAANWTNFVTRTQGVPAEGDIIKFSNLYHKNSSGIGIRNISSRKFGGVVFERGQTPIKQTTLNLASGATILFESAASDSTWTCNIGCEGTNIINIAMGKKLTLNWRNVTGPGATLVKDGYGSFFANTHNSSDLPCNVGMLLLRAGTFGCHYAKIPEVRFDSDDSSALLQLGTRSPHANDATYNRVGFFIENGLLAESDGVANTTHGVTSAYGQNLVFTGTPKVQEMVFTGTFYGSAGLVWNPGDAAYSFAFKKATHQTTGLIAVSNGTVRVRDGASFPNLSQVMVDGSNSRIRVETSGVIFPAATVALSQSGKLALASGVHLSVAAVTIDGVAVGEGLYHGVGAESQMGSVEASWIDGAGYVAVGISAGAQTSTTWTGAGADTLSSTAANWSGTAPVLTDGNAFVTVTGGTGFTAVGGVWLNGFDITGVSTFALGASPGKELWIGSGGVHGGTGTYSINAPVSMAARQTWRFKEGATVSFNAPFSGGIGASSVSLDGTGVVFNVNAAIGPAGFQTDIEHRNTINIAAGIVNDADLRLFNDVPGDPWGQWTKSLVVFKGGAQTVMNGFTHNTNSTWHMTFEDNADVVFKGGFLSRNSTYFKTVGKNARIRFDKPFLARNSLAAQSFDDSAVIELNAEGNCLSQANPWGVSGGYPTLSRGTIRLLVPFALKDFRLPDGTFEYNGTPLTGIEAGRFDISGAMTLDLCGNDQSLQCLYARGGTIASDGDATMTLNDRGSGNWTSTTANKTRADYATWTGGAGLVFNGASADWPRYMMKVSSTTGRLEVVQGRLVFPSAVGDALVTSIGSESATSVARPATNAGWPNCSEVTVRGGTLEIEHSNTFGKQTVVKFEETDGAYGKIKLAAGVSQHVDSLWVDGVKMPIGTYGAAGSGAQFVRADLFDAGGTGVLCVPGSATVMVFR